jgi:tight adherence protein C
MSSLYLTFALVGTFTAVVMSIVGIQAATANRRRALELLQAHVAELPDLRKQELAQPFADRVLSPFISSMVRFAKRVTPIGMRERIQRLLVLGGNTTLTAEKVAATKIFGAAGGVVGGLVLTPLWGLPTWMAIAVPAFLGLFVYLLPGAGIGQRAVHRQKAIQMALPDVMDLLTISVEAGLGFDAALAHVRKNVPGPLSEEIGRMLQEMQLVVPRADAFRALTERTDVPELTAFALAMIQADTFGISIAKVLRAQSKELRVRRRQRAEEKAMKVPVKLLFPMIVGILPSTFVVIIGPGAIRLARSFLGT